MKLFILSIIILFLNSCIIFGGKLVPNAPSEQIAPPTGGAEFCLTTMGFPKLSPELGRAIQSGAANRGFNLSQVEICDENTNLRIHISSANNDKSGTTFGLSLLSAVTIGILPSVPSWSEVTILYQWKSKNSPVYIQKYYAREQFLGSLWAHLWWRSAYPIRLSSQILTEATEQFVGTIGKSKTPIYIKIETQSGKSFHLVRLEQNQSESTLLDLDGNEIPLGNDKVINKQLLEKMIPF
ncbi:hypothetical protein P3G55_07755 [Leptospira sp. 96542]|nr:hypothetical protein [Leptospira sp. 96542]